MATLLRKHWGMIVLTLFVAGIGVVHAARPRSSSPEDSARLQAFHFKLEVPGYVSAVMSKVENLGSENDVIDHKIMTRTGEQAIRKLPGRLKTTPVTLTTAETKNNDLWSWRQMVVDGNVNDARKHCTITMLDQEGSTVKSWELTNAWPSALTFSCDDDGNALVRLTIVAEEMCVEGMGSSPRSRPSPQSPMPQQPHSPPPSDTKGGGDIDL